MCFSESGDRKYKLKCAIIAVISLIINTILSGLSIIMLTAMINRQSPNRFQEYFQRLCVNNFGYIDKNIVFAFFGIVLTLCVLGVFVSIILLLGIKYNKPGCLAAYLCYGVQTCILLLIGVILLTLKVHWGFAIVMLFFSALICGATIKVNHYYEAMVQDEFIKHQNNISDLTLLIGADSSDDLISLSTE